MPVFYKIVNIKSGNCNINNFLPVIFNRGKSVTSVHYVQSIIHNVLEQGLTSIVGVRPSPGGVMRVCTKANDGVNSSSPSPASPFPRVWGTTSSYGRYADPITLSFGPPPLDVLIFTAVRSLE